MQKERDVAEATSVKQELHAMKQGLKAHVNRVRMSLYVS
ncbi:MAG: hypothetical protein Sv326_1176 [Candidatus Fermentimicrarchaeum limneticum]|uniref:Uncharacterized protein n=1 Tax=Fermentimicrarchaeum limneticum TaxID=2795018 RepID=A0A7D5XDI6_FERL1|nr:MAG: hypothetical protein Sv326_1176 [Candidatus Fermentimicrarchaeum limneticum]